MTTLLYVSLWLLSGFLAAWLMQRYLDDGKFDYKALPVFILTLFGGATLFVALVMSVIKAVPSLCNKLNDITIFKAKEPK